jgi:hypothetical protein
MNHSKESLRQRILAEAPDPMAVLFWFDTLYHRHEQNPEFTEEQIYTMLTDKTSPKSKL